MHSRPYASGSRTHRAFTLIELLTVIAIIGILAAIIVPTVSKARNVAKKAQCVARLRQWGTAANLCANENKSVVALFFNSGAFSYGNYMNGKNMLVQSSNGSISNKSVVQAMSTCPTGINGDNSLASVTHYAFVIPIGVTSRDARILKADGNQYYYRASDAFAPAKLLFMVEVSNMTAINPGSLGGIRSAIEDGNSIKKMQTAETYVRHGGIAHGLFLDGHVGSLTTTDTNYTQSRELLDRYFSLK